MLDILTIVHGLSDSVTASRIRCVCKKLAKLRAKPTKYIYSDRVEYRVGVKRHREDGPAIEWDDGTKMWYLYGNYHREDGPAVEWDDGSREWYLQGKYHREGGPAVERSDGSREWYLHGNYHREDGPAIEWRDGTKIWYVYGQRHREDGPAVEWEMELDGGIYTENFTKNTVGYNGAMELMSGIYMDIIIRRFYDMTMEKGGT